MAKVTSPPLDNIRDRYNALGKTLAEKMRGERKDMVKMKAIATLQKQLGIEDDGLMKTVESLMETTDRIIAQMEKGLDIPK